MTNRIQSLRSSVTGVRPIAQPPGAMFTNFADRQLGVVDPTQAPIDLVAVRFFSTMAAYVQGDYVVNGGQLYRAASVVAAGAFNPAQWTAVVAQGAAPGGVAAAAWAGTLAGAIALFPAAVVLSGGQVLFVAGRNTVQDGYEGNFIYRAGDSATVFDQSGLGFVDAAGRRWFRVYPAGQINAAWFGASSSNPDNTVALQAWLSAIPQGAQALLPFGQFNYAGSLAHNGYISIQGFGVGSHLHYTGTGLALDLDNPRFSSMRDFRLTGTPAALGGIYIRKAQEGYFDNNVRVENFTGPGAFARRFSSCWSGMVLGGCSKSSTNGVICDTALGSLGRAGDGIVNCFSFIGHSFAGCTGIGLDFQSGFAVSVTNACDFSTTGTAIEIARAVVFPDQVRNYIITGSYFESADSIRIGRGASSTGCAVYGVIDKNYFGTGNPPHIYKASSIEIGAQTMPSQATVDVGCDGTVCYSEFGVDDHSVGPTTLARFNVGSLNMGTGVFNTYDLLPTYTVATLPAPSVRQIAFVSNATGGAVLAYANGANWLRCTDASVVN